MPEPRDSPTDELKQELASLLTRVQAIETRLAHLEQPATQSATEKPLAPEPRVEQPWIPERQPPLPRFLSPIARSEPAYVSTSSAPQPFETRVGLTWINRIGVVTLVLGAAFFFKYAADNRWIGETARVLLGVAAGLVTLFAAELLFRRRQFIFAQGICGLGISLLYLAFYVGFGFYRLLPLLAAWALMILVTAAAAALALRYGSMAIAILGMCGGYVTPLLLSTRTDSPWILLPYLLAIGVGAVVLARARRWRPLHAIAFVATVILYPRLLPASFHRDPRPVATVALFAFFALFAFADVPWILYASQVLAGLALTLLWLRATPYLAFSFVLGAAGLLIADRSRRPPAAIVSFGIFWAGYALWCRSGCTTAGTGVVFLYLTAGFLLYACWAALRMKQSPNLQTAPVTILPMAGAVYFGCAYVLLSPEHRAWLGLHAAALAAVYLLLGVRFWNAEPEEERDTRPALLSFGLALTFLTLALPIQFTGIRITLSWAVEAAALAWVSRYFDDTRARFGAIAIYALVVLRLFIFDTATAVPHLPLIDARFATFALSAVCLWLGAYWMKAARVPAAWVYGAGHAVMLSVCLLELDDWITGSANAENRAGLAAVSSSILAAVYAVIIIAIGLVRRFQLDRILGVGLTALVMLKLYLYDVWKAGKLFRTAAFITLGALLLVSSYLYSRLWPAIQTWLGTTEEERR